MKYKYLVYLTVIVSLSVVSAFGLEVGIDASTPTEKTWRQTDWSGPGGVEFIEEGDRIGFNGYRSVRSVIVPRRDETDGDIEIGL